MGDEVMTQPQAWAAYDRWLQDPRVTFVDESPEISVLGVLDDVPSSPRH